MLEIVMICIAEGPLARPMGLSACCALPGSVQEQIHPSTAFYSFLLLLPISCPLILWDSHINCYVPTSVSGSVLWGNPG